MKIYSARVEPDKVPLWVSLHLGSNGYYWVRFLVVTDRKADVAGLLEDRGIDGNTAALIARRARPVAGPDPLAGYTDGKPAVFAHLAFGTGPLIQLQLGEGRRSERLTDHFAHQAQQ